MTRSTRNVRRCALQALYQFDTGSAETPDLVREALASGPGDADCHERGFELAQAAWAGHHTADAAIAEFTPEWPTHRQPVIDRNILRLAYHEITAGETPPKVAINEAVELAREYSTEKSPSFINAVLDRIYRAGKDPEAERDLAAESAEQATTASGDDAAS